MPLNRFGLQPLRVASFLRSPELPICHHGRSVSWDRVSQSICVERSFLGLRDLNFGFVAMSAKVRCAEALAVAAGEAKTEEVWATCACCGLTEECTPDYVARVRERYSGRWVCGLCGEAVKDEIRRAGKRISMEEALSRHTTFSKSFSSSPPPFDTAEPLIAAMRHLLRRSLGSPRAVRSTPNSPHREAAARPSHDARRTLARSGSTL